MQLDRARIAICERTWADNLDLALQVMRAYGPALVVCGLATIVPLAVFNHAFVVAAYPDLAVEEIPLGVYYWLVILTLIEAPLATAPITLYLGHALFDEKPRAADVARGFGACLPQMLLLQVGLRALLILPLVTIIIPYGVWPYLSEVILLERNPLTARRGQLSTLQRSSILHRGNSGEYLVRATLAGLLAMLLVIAFYLSGDLLVSGVIGFDGGETALLIQFQAAVWIVVVYFTVARFLAYLDQRIRSEGWEVELLLRAQRARLERQTA